MSSTNCLQSVDHQKSCKEWKPKTHGEYIACCEKCQIPVCFSSGLECERVALSLEQDGRKDSRGPRLRDDLTELGLRRHDRFEADTLNHDWLTLFNESALPAGAMFWRSKAEEGVRHFNILLDVELGLSLQQAACLDNMH
eukprot:5706013-Amphidinium_carterae.1